MTTQHTPGPWKSNSMEIFTDTGKTSKRIAFATGRAQGDDNTLKEIKANAHLIAAAPELLEACKAAETLFSKMLAHSELNPRHPIHQLRAAIAKARGEA